MRKPYFLTKIIASTKVDWGNKKYLGYGRNLIFGTATHHSKMASLKD
jgi:hypothetical protein